MKPLIRLLKKLSPFRRVKYPTAFSFCRVNEVGRNRGKVAAVLLIAIMSVSCLSPAQQLAREGDDYLSKKDWDRAVVSYSQARDIDPKLKLDRQVASAYMGKAQQCFNNNDYGSAVFNYEKAEGSDPEIKAGFDIGYTYYQIGVTYFKQGKYEAALKNLSTAINGGYKYSAAYAARAMVYNALGMYSGTIGDASLCLELAPRSVEAYLMRGYAYLSVGEYHKAVADLTKAIELDVTARDGYFYRGMAWKDSGEFRMAINDFKRVVEIDPSFGAGYIWLGRVYYLMTDYYSAIEQFTHVIELNGSDTAVTYNDRAVSLGRIGELNAAAADLTTLISMNPAFALAYYNLGVVYMKMAQPWHAVEALDAYLCLDLSDQFGCRGLAYGWRGYYPEYFICCNRSGSSERAINRCDRILSRSARQNNLPYMEDALYFGSESADYMW